MASGAYNQGLLQLKNGTTNWTSADIRVALIKTGGGFSFDKTHTALSTALGSAESTATGYSRKTTSSRTIAANGSSMPVTYRIGNVTWTALGGASNDTLDGAIIYLYNASDASAVPLFFCDPSNLGTNGSDITLQFDASTGVYYVTN